MIFQIPLTQGMFAIVDEEDYEHLSQYKWHAIRAKRKHHDNYFYAARMQKGKRLWMHRELLNPDQGKEIDHINHNGLDNRKSNIRIVTRSQNTMNRRYADKGLPRGIYAVNGKYRSRICVNGKNKSLGMFTNKQDAINAYNEASKLFYGEFGILNEVS